MILELIVPVIILCVITVTDVFVLLSVSQEFVLAEYVRHLVSLMATLVRLLANVVLATAWTVIVVIGPVMEPVCTVLQAVVIIITKEKIQKMNVMVRVLVAGLVMATSQEDVNIPALQSPAAVCRIAIT